MGFQRWPKLEISDIKCNQDTRYKIAFLYTSATAMILPQPFQDCNAEIAVATDVTYCPVQSLHRPNSMSIDDPASDVVVDVDVDVDVIPSHPLGVKPSGNALTAVHNIRPAIGSLTVLSDELIMLLLECLDSTSLLRLGATCKALYAFTRAEELWKALFIE